MPGGLTHLLDIEGAHALLHAGRPGPGRIFGAGEVGLERHHARVDEQQRRVVVEQGCGRHYRVPPRGEVVEESTPDFGGLHVVIS